MGKGIIWHDWTNYSEPKQKEYVEDIEQTLKKDCIQNERKAFVADLISELAVKDVEFDKDKRVRDQILGVQAFFERLESIKMSENKETFDKLNDLI